MATTQEPSGIARVERVERTAKICHEVNRGLCIGLGDMSQPAWEDAPDWQRDSAIHGVEAILAGAVTRPSDSHYSWLREKQAAGWSYGPTKDPAAKLHPCMVPFEELPREQQLKDILFLTTVQTLGLNRSNT